MSVFGIVYAAAAAAAETVHGGGVEVTDDPTATGLPQLDPTWWPSQIFWLALTFGVLYWLMAGRFLPAISQ